MPTHNQPQRPAPTRAASKPAAPGDESADRLLPFACEYPYAACTRKTRMTFQDYEALHRTPNVYTACRQHNLHSFERIIEDRPGFVAIKILDGVR